MTQSWASDATLVEIGPQLERLIHLTPQVRRFLEGEKYFLSATKGMGKTLLLGYKRYLLQQKHGAEIQFVPSGKPYLDNMADLPSMSNEHQDFFGSVEQAKKVWSLAFRLSALSHQQEPFVLPAETLPKHMRNWFSRERNVDPTLVFHEIARLSVREINRNFDESHGAVEAAFRRIQDGIFFFIDRVDQALMSLPRDAWISLQCGLVEAAWDIMSTNRHVKVYGTVRQEAFSNYSSHTKANLSGGVTELAYADAELPMLLDKLTTVYESKRSFKDFIGFGEVTNSYASCAEDSFKYLVRHTVGRPRDLVRMGERISDARAHLTDSTYKEIINKTAANIISDEIFSEMRVFLECINDPAERSRLWQLLPYSVLTRDDMRRVSAEFNHANMLGSGKATAGRHPFFELYALGLLGVVQDGVDGQVQRFKHPDDPIPFHNDGQVPAADFYLVHPGLHDAITTANKRYRVLRFLPIGDGYAWKPRMTKMAIAQQHLWNCCRREGSPMSLTDSPDLANMVLEVLREYHEIQQSQGHLSDIRRLDSWRDLFNILNSDNQYSDLRFWLNQAVS